MINAASVLFCLVGLIPSSLIAEHPNHDSFAEVEWNPETGNFEVALAVNAADLERAISMMCDQPIDIDSVESIDRLLRDYVELNFVVSSRDSNQHPVLWVGSEIESAEAWLYFEFEGGDSTKPLVDFRIFNRILFECCDMQLNHIQFRIGTKNRHKIATTHRPIVEFEGPFSKNSMETPRNR